MPGFDGTGPLGKGPMTGHANGYCVVKEDTNNPNGLEGFIGIEGKKINQSSKSLSIKWIDDEINKNLKEVFMPGGDGTGPAGFGPMTGHAAGYCAGYSAPGFANPIGGRGFFGRGGGGFGGRGRGYRNIYYATGLPGWSRYPWGGVANIPCSTFNSQMTSEQEIELLKNQAKYMQEDINNVNERIKELESNPAGKEK